MKKILAVILVLIIAVSFFPSALGETGVFKSGNLSMLSSGVRDEEYGPITLKRNQTKEAWVAWNYTSIIDANPSAYDFHVTYYKLKGIGSNPTVEITGSAASWLSAKIKSKKLYLTVKGINKTQNTKTAVVTIKDNKGDFAKLKIYRAGANKFTAIKQVGKTIHLKIKFAKAAENHAYIRLVIFDREGNVVDLEDSYPTNQKPVSGTEYVYDLTKLKKGYTYAFTIGYMCPYMSSANASWAAAICLKSASGSQSGNVKYCGGNSFNNEFLFNLAK